MQVFSNTEMAQQNIGLHIYMSNVITGGGNMRSVAQKRHPGKKLPEKTQDKQRELCTGMVCFYTDNDY